jgi:electron transport complex protein RnfG
MIKPTLVLFLVCVVIAGSLAFVNRATDDVIEARTKAEQEEFRKQVMDKADTFEMVNPEGIPQEVTEVYAAFNGTDIVGYVIGVAPKGYGGNIGMIVGVSMEGQVTGVIIGDHNETPGLGSRAKEPGFISQFTGISMKDTLTVVKQEKKSSNEIQALSGATITSRAVTEGVSAALEMAEMMIEGGN